jgi:hypothetical protein
LPSCRSHRPHCAVFSLWSPVFVPLHSACVSRVVSLLVLLVAYPTLHVSPRQQGVLAFYGALTAVTVIIKWTISCRFAPVRVCCSLVCWISLWLPASLSLVCRCHWPPLIAHLAPGLSACSLALVLVLYFCSLALARLTLFVPVLPLLSIRCLRIQGSHVFGGWWFWTHNITARSASAVCFCR